MSPPRKDMEELENLGKFKASSELWAGFTGGATIRVGKYI